MNKVLPAAAVLFALTACGGDYPAQLGNEAANVQCVHPYVLDRDDAGRVTGLTFLDASFCTEARP